MGQFTQTNPNPFQPTPMARDATRVPVGAPPPPTPDAFRIMLLHALLPERAAAANDSATAQFRRSPRGQEVAKMAAGDPFLGAIGGVGRAAMLPSSLGRVVDATGGATRVAAEVVPRAYEYADLVSLHPKELIKIADAEIARDKNITKELFGEEGAKIYSRLQARANSMMASPQEADAAYNKVVEMESRLTPAQQNRLFGIGETGFNVDDFKNIRRTAQDYLYADEFTTGDLLNTVARELTTGEPHKDVVSAIRLKAALAELGKRGVEGNDLLGALVARAARTKASEGDLMELFKTRMEQMRATGKAGNTPALPSGK